MDTTFLTAPNHQEIFLQVQENALLLSKIYAHQGHKGIDFVDLFLAARVMQNAEVTVLVTGNKKDFPSCVFDIVNVLNYEEENSVIRSIVVLRFNNDKFKDCYRKLQKVNA